ncbi:MAG: hypothetical protein P4L40_14400 [Terracidiphilus sp.]|nr:hypothetical protein [Terracidiphilus sp.]
MNAIPTVFSSVRFSVFAALAGDMKDGDDSGADAPAARAMVADVPDPAVERVDRVNRVVRSFTSNLWATKLRKWTDLNW